MPELASEKQEVGSAAAGVNRRNIGALCSSEPASSLAPHDLMLYPSVSSPKTRARMSMGSFRPQLFLISCGEDMGGSPLAAQLHI